MNSKLARLGLCVAILTVAASPAKATPYTFTNLGSGWAFAINDAGLVAGISVGSTWDSIATATVWNRGTAITLGTGVAYGINNAGQVAGRSDDVAIVWTMTSNGIAATSLGGGIANGINDIGQVVGHSTNSRAPVLWNGSEPSILRSPEIGGGGNASAINNTGQIAGYTRDIYNMYSSATVWNGDAVTVLGTGMASAINDAGEVAWSFWGGDGISFASVWSGATTTTLGKGGAFGINDAGQVVGYSYDASGTAAATIWNGTVATNLNSFLTASEINAGWVLDRAYGINDSGSIVGRAYNTRTGTGNAFLLSVSEVPEPRTYALLLIGLGMMSFVRSCRKNRKRS